MRYCRPHISTNPVSISADQHTDHAADSKTHDGTHPSAADEHPYRTNGFANGISDVSPVFNGGQSCMCCAIHVLHRHHHKRAAPHRDRRCTVCVRVQPNRGVCHTTEQLRVRNFVPNRRPYHVSNGFLSDFQRTNHVASGIFS